MVAADSRTLMKAWVLVCFYSLFASSVLCYLYCVWYLVMKRVLLKKNECVLVMTLFCDYSA